MTAEFISRLIGMVVFAIAGAHLGAEIADFLDLTIEDRAFIFGLTGILFGLIVTPYLTIRPVLILRRLINELPIEKLLVSLLGGLVGLGLSLLVAYPLSLVEAPIGTLAPAAVSLVSGYLGLTIFGIRSKEIIDLLGQSIARPNTRMSTTTSRRILVDTSVLIDGRIVEVAETGFIGGTLVIPRFVLSELHRVADSSDQLRRNRGRRGLNIVNKLQHSTTIPVRIIDDDLEEVLDVDNKLVALAIAQNAALVTNDYNLNQVAEAQGVNVLNINELANAVRSIYIPGESFAIRIIQEGTDANQGVGYLDDGTMVVVEQGKHYMDRSIPVTVTKLITKPTGRMIFAMPEALYRRQQQANNASPQASSQ